ncbi:MAG: type II toxin-antitoxin system HigA family antitoxin [Fimbriimonadales bacterium]
MRAVETYIIENDEDLAKAIDMLAQVFDAKPGTPDGDRAEVLSLTIEKYEDRRFPMAAPDPVGAIRFAMDQRGYTQADLARILGSKSRASEVLSGKRKLTIPMIQRLHADFRIPLESLLGSAAEDAA